MSVTRAYLPVLLQLSGHPSSLSCLSVVFPLLGDLPSTSFSLIIIFFFSLFFTFYSNLRFLFFFFLFLFIFLFFLFFILIYYYCYLFILFLIRPPLLHTSVSSDSALSFVGV